MVRIFISYAAEDRPSAERLAHLLAEHGFTVWWDRKIPLGSVFDQVIEENLAQADCVLVLWTASSVQSRWVRAEASEAAAREALVPVLMESGLKIPLEFRLLQAANLADWTGDAQHVEFSSLLAHITAIGGRVATAREHAGRTAEPPTERGQPQGGARPDQPLRERKEISPRERRHVRRRLGWTATLLASSAALLAAAIAAALWRVPTRLQLDLVVDRFAFTLAGERSVDLPSRPLGFSTLSVENFDRLTFTPERVRWIDRPTEASRMLRRGTTVVLNSAGEEAPAVVVLESAGRGTGASGAGRLQPVAIAPGSRVILTTSPDAPHRISLKIEGQPLDTNVLPAAELALSATHVTLEDAAQGAAAGRRLTLAFSLPEDQPFVQLHGARRSFAITAALSTPSALDLLDGAEVSGIELLRQGSGGTVESAIVGNGEIRYPGQPSIAPVRVGARDFVTLGETSRTTVTRLELAPAQAGMQLTMDSVAGEAVLASGGVERGLRITALERLWHESRAGVLLLAGLCLTTGLAGGYRLYRDLTPA
jgi:hypothetical protein